jgi:hypothetical protein
MVRCSWPIVSVETIGNDFLMHVKGIQTMQHNITLFTWTFFIPTAGERRAESSMRASPATLVPPRPDNAAENERSPVESSTA